MHSKCLIFRTEACDLGHPCCLLIAYERCVQQMTWLSVAFLHPDVAVGLRHAGLRIQEGHADAALGTETGIVAAAVFYGLPVELVAEPENRQCSQENVE